MNFSFKSSQASDLQKIHKLLISIQTEQRYQRVDLARCLSAIHKRDSLDDRPETEEPDGDSVS